MLVASGAVLSSTKDFPVRGEILPAESEAAPLSIRMKFSAPLPVTPVSVRILSVAPEPLTSVPKEQSPQSS